ncbi:uncharacterized protein LOC129780289 isoform X2 [Toxorhynchites rutilus septentrionalis]|uniref:uncharacterized protein LOC129780289 isoform X2 n=1 Tax=Toxorhynchites rutilus septentrionalis TaxID=329112 RepID=UPI00247887AD|nr:uncharacterized protein LOC129780289 isoform X2 [Toxorhynchites rutilus septentrionalis]
MEGRQPDYIIGTHGIPQLVSGVLRPVRKRDKMHPSNNSNNNAASITDPIKLNKCLYNLTVRNAAVGDHPSKSASKTKRDIAIRRNLCGNQSNSTTGSNGSSVSSVSSSPSSSSTSVFSNWRGPIASSSVTHCDPPRNARSYSNTSSIPRSRIHNLRGDIRLATSTINRNSNHNVRLSDAGGGTQTLLNSRQRRNAGEPSDLNCGSNVVRQCRPADSYEGLWIVSGQCATR